MTPGPTVGDERDGSGAGPLGTAGTGRRSDPVGTIRSVGTTGSMAGSGVTGGAVTGPVITGPDATGPDVAGPDATGPAITGPDVAGTDVAGPADDTPYSDPVGVRTGSEDSDQPVGSEGSPLPRTDRRQVRQRDRRHRVAMAGAWLLGLAALTAVLYLSSVRSYFPDSDGATAVLEGQSMAAGHLTLRGWALSVDSFWTVDAVVYTVGVWLLGVRAVLQQLVPAVIAALVIVVGILMAKDGRRGTASVASGVTVVALLGMPGLLLSYFLLRGPVHVGTTLWALVAFYALRKGRMGIGWAVAVIFLAAGLNGDLQMVGLGVAPVFFAGVVAMLRTRTWRRGAPLVGAAAAGVVLAVVVRKGAELIGTFGIGKVQPSADTSQVLANLKHLPSDFSQMLGLTHTTHGVPVALVAVHVVGLVLVVAAVVYFAARLIVGCIKGTGSRHGTGPAARSATADPPDPDPEYWRLDDLLILGCLGGVVVFAKLTLGSLYTYDRYLTSAVIFGCILAGRLVAEWVSTTRSTRLLRPAAVVGAATVVAFGAGFGLALAQPTPASPLAALDSFLHSHDLTNGVGDYWTASIITVETDNSVTVRPVIADPNRSYRVVRYQRQSSAAWYTGQPFQFLVYNIAQADGVNAQVAAATWGPIAHTYDVGTYRVLVWSHPLPVSASGFDSG